MKKYLVIGDPVAHSLSPAMQQAALEALQLDAVYGKRQVPLTELAAFCQTARRELAGFNVTVPHKGAVIPFLDEVTPEAAAAGSVNTVTVTEEGRLLGDSTDGYGLAAALQENFHWDAAGKKILLLGAGGAAHAVAFTLARRGAAAIFIVNRTPAKAQELADQLKAAFPRLDCEASASPGCGKWDLLLQATSLGLQESDPLPCPAALLDPARISCAFDMVYRKSLFQQRAAAAGVPVAGGLEMLLYQGARSLEIWTRRSAPVEVMRNALYRAAGVPLTVKIWMEK